MLALTMLENFPCMPSFWSCNHLAMVLTVLIYSYFKFINLLADLLQTGCLVFWIQECLYVSLSLSLISSLCVSLSLSLYFSSFT